MESVIDKECIKYFVRLNESQKKSMLEMMKSFLEKSEGTLENISIDEYNRELDEAKERITNGKFTSFESLVNESQKW